MKGERINVEKKENKAKREKARQIERAFMIIVE
jgi:hypothetical protein